MFMGWSSFCELGRPRAEGPGELGIIVSFIACLISDQFFVDAFEVETLKGVRRRQNPRMPSFTLLDYAMGGRNPMLRWVFGRATLLQGPPSRSEP